MPTIKQLHKMWRTDLEFFGGDPRIVGYPEDKHSAPFSGEVIGTLEYDEKTGDLKVNVKKESSSTDPKDSEPPSKAQ